MIRAEHPDHKLAIEEGTEEDWEALLLSSIDDVEVAVTGEIGMVDAEPMVRVEEAGGEQTTYAKVDQAVAKKIVSEHLEKGKKVENIAVGRRKDQE